MVGRALAAPAGLGSPHSNGRLGSLLDSQGRSSPHARGEGRFEPRAVKLGLRGEGYTEVREGLEIGEEVVTSATFLIDAESNLKAALQAFSQPDQGS